LPELTADGRAKTRGANGVTHIPALFTAPALWTAAGVFAP